MPELLSAELLSIRLRAPRLRLDMVALSIGLVTLCLAWPGASNAGPSSSSSSSSSRGQATQYNAAMTLYNTANYAQALSAFEAIARKSPTDDTAHYYIALCCQGLHQNSRAALEYRYVASASRNLQMRQMAQKGYDSLTRLQSAAVAQAAPTAPSSVSSSGAASLGISGANSSSGASSSSSSAVVRGSRVKKVIEFYTTWCHVCSEFADTFERTKAKYNGRIQFEQLNAEEPENSELKAKYNVKAYPTLIYLDASGTVLRRGEGAPMGPNFGNIIESL